MNDTEPVRYSLAWSLAQEGLPKRKAVRTFVRSPGFRTQGDAVKWMWQQTCDLDSCRLESGPDGMWRGSCAVMR